MTLKPTLFLLVLLLTAALLGADVLVHKDGRRIEGEVVKKTATEVVFKTRFGTVTFPASDVKEIIKKKTRDQEYDERLGRAKSANDFFELGQWCTENKLKRRGKKHFEKAIELDPNHEGANLALGRVKYKDEWMTPEERDERQRAERTEEMAERGFVQHEGQWVTPEEKAKLEQGLVKHEGRWMTKAESMKLKGFIEFEGEWLPESHALARESHARLLKLAEAKLGIAFGNDVVVIGDADAGVLDTIAKRADFARDWFGKRWSIEPGLALFEGRLAELYPFVNDALYKKTIPLAVERSKYMPEGWGKSVAKRYGYTWVNPIRVAGSTLRNRPDSHLNGTCYHNFGHVLAISLADNGRNLPAWYEEGLACLIEEIAHGQNTVFCKASSASSGGSSSGEAHRPVFDDKAMRDDGWRKRLALELDKGGIEPFDKLARREFHQLALVDIATSRAILEWLLLKGEGKLGKFHAILRKHAPEQPNRVVLIGKDRHKCYDEAFKAAVGMTHRQADAEWRRWFKTEGQKK